MALQRLPALCDLLGPAHIKSKLLPVLVALFSKTKILSIKVSCLVGAPVLTQICFHATIPLLEAPTLVDVILPALARTKTREPSVMVRPGADRRWRHSLCTKQWPPKWNTWCKPPKCSLVCGCWPWYVAALTQCPALNETQFSRFMKVIQAIGHKVEQAQRGALQRSQHLQQHTSEHMGAAPSRTASPKVPIPVPSTATSDDVDLAALVGHSVPNTSHSAPSKTGAALLDDIPPTLPRAPTTMAAPASQPKAASLRTLPLPMKPSPMEPPVAARATLAPPPGWQGGASGAVLVPERTSGASTPVTAMAAPSKSAWAEFDPLL